jgi:hypothetical protein
MQDLPSHQLDHFDLLFANEAFFQFQDQSLPRVNDCLRSLGINSIISCIKNPDTENNEKNEGPSYKSKISILENSGFNIVKDISRIGCNRRLLIFERQEV